MEGFLEAFEDIFHGGGNDEEQPVNTPQVNATIMDFREDLIDYKRALFNDLVQSNKKQDAGSMDAMYTYHSLFLQSIAHMIGQLDGSPVPSPKLDNYPQSNEKFSILQSVLQKEIIGKVDAKTLAYNELFLMSTDHPYRFIENPQTSEKK